MEGKQGEDMYKARYQDRLKFGITSYSTSTTRLNLF